MQVTFYNNNSSMDVVNKSLTTIKTVDCEAYKGFTVESPVMIVARDDSLLNSNYMYIDKTGRYYSCEIRIINGRKMSITGSVDVLKSFWSSIQNCPCMAERCSDSRYYDKDIVDEMIMKKLQTTTQYNGLPLYNNFNPFGERNDNWVLTMRGKADYGD